MAQYGFQIALELTNLVPVRDLAISGFIKVLEYARELRKSGSDIVVETDLAMVFGQLNVEPEIEDAFKILVKQRAFIPTFPGSDLGLASGPGPTVVNAIGDRALLSTVIQLSMLAYFCNRQSLAEMIAGAMDLRFKARIRDAPPDPGSYGISNTLKACSSQCSAFEWHLLRKKAFGYLQACIPAYSLSMPHLVDISASSILAFMDMLSIVQRFPEERSISVSNDTGCIIILLWAHYIGGLTVSIINREGQEAKVGSNSTSHVVIFSDIQAGNSESSQLNGTTSMREDPVIRLHEKDMSVVFECQPTTKLRIISRIEERHSLSGYGIEHLRRAFNTCFITPDEDPIYADVKALVTALTICGSTRLIRGGVFNADHRIQEHLEIAIEVWRIQDAARLIFEVDGHDTLDMRQVETYVKDPTLQPISFTSLPVALDRVALKHGIRDEKAVVDQYLLRPIESLVQILLLLSCVHDVRSCSATPLVLQPYFSVEVLKNLDKDLYDTRGTSIVLDPESIFHGVARLLMSSSLDVSNDLYSGYQHDRRLVSLYSDFGWSVFLDTFGGKDPSMTRREIVHLQHGTPMKESTHERRQRVRDGLNHFFVRLPDQSPCRGLTYTPRCSANVVRRLEDWVTSANEFEFATYLDIEPSSEWAGFTIEPKLWKEYTSCREMHHALWNCTITPSCLCTKPTQKRIPCDKSYNIKLGLTAATVVSWHLPPESRNQIQEKILIVLTRGNPYIRWIALLNSVASIHKERSNRSVLLVSDGCCEDCALGYASSRDGKWFMLL